MGESLEGVNRGWLTNEASEISCQLSFAFPRQWSLSYDHKVESIPPEKPVRSRTWIINPEVRVAPKPFQGGIFVEYTE